jgi:hypothetical protein
MSRAGGVPARSSPSLPSLFITPHPDTISPTAWHIAGGVCAHKKRVPCFHGTLRLFDRREALTSDRAFRHDHRRHRIHRRRHPNAAPSVSLH